MRRALLILALLIGLAASALDTHRWLHVYRNSRDFTTLRLDSVEITHAEVGGEAAMRIESQEGVVNVPLSDIGRAVVGRNVPALHITIPGDSTLPDLKEKQVYLDALLRVEGEGIFDDLDSVPLKIKGRGNSTWNYQKKPYRLKFAKKTSLLGLPAQKNFVLIANYIDCSNIRNAVAFEIARLLGIPFTNEIRPVRVFFNGIPKGSYFATPKVGISPGSVDIPEETGVLYELDTNYDEDYKFRSETYGLPVMIKDPDLEEIALEAGVEPEDLLARWQEDFNRLESLVATGSYEEFSQMVDIPSLVNFLLVQNLCGNQEFNWPKSLFIHRSSGDDIFHFGPVWDFDWAFNYYPTGELENPRFVLMPYATNYKASALFRQFCKDPGFMQLCREAFDDFVADKYPRLLEFIDAYVAGIEPSTLENGLLWPDHPSVARSSFDMRASVEALKAWLDGRISYISSHPRLGLY